MPRYDPTADPTKPSKESDDSTDRPTMSDVRHTPPHETSVNSVWGRGPTDDGHSLDAPSVGLNDEDRTPADD